MKIEEILRKLFNWMQKNHFFSLDPFDTLSFIKIKELFPYFLRPLFNSKKIRSNQAIAQIIRGLLFLNKIKEAENIANYLKDSNGGYGEGFKWICDEKWLIREWTPDATCSAICGIALIELYNTTKKEIYKIMAKKTANYILQNFKIIKKGKNKICISYTPVDYACIINSNLFLANFFLRCGYEEICDKILNYIFEKQNKDGSFYYWAEEIKTKEIDHLHTAFNLRNLFEIWKIKKDEKIKERMFSLFDYYSKNLFLDDLPKYTNLRFYPIDGQTLSQAIYVFTLFSKIEKAEKIVKFSIENFWNEKGYFYYRKYKFFTIKTPYIRWIQAPFFESLSLFYRTTKILPLNTPSSV